jgi:hypothetical protein
VPSIEEILFELTRTGFRVRPLFVHHDPAIDLDGPGANGGWPLFFIPDLHLLSHTRAEGYQDHFNLNAERKNVLLAFLVRLVELRAEKTLPNLAVYQLGDLHDLWREQEHWWWHEPLPHMLDRQVESHGDLFALFRELRVVRLVGNHDHRLRDSGERERLASHPIARDLPLERLVPRMTSLPWGINARIDLFHADQIDRIETGFFSFLDPIGARMAAEFGGTDEWHYELLLRGRPTIHPASLRSPKG